MDGLELMGNPMNKWMIWGETPLFLVQHPSVFVEICGEQVLHDGT